jgi:hypothetical protein
MKKQTPVPDFWLVKIDETEYRCDSMRQRVKKIWATYLIDVSRHTFCCETTPSYWCDFVESYPEHLDSSDESDMEKLADEICESDDTAGMYVHVSDFTHKQPLDRLPRNRKLHLSRKGHRKEELAYAKAARRAHGVESDLKELYEELLNSVREYVHCNSLL